MSNSDMISLDNLVNEKMEENLKDMQLYRNILIRMKTFEQLQIDRNKIIQGLFNIEDDIRETYQIAKTTLTANKNVKEQLDEEIEMNKELIARLNSLERTFEEMQLDLRNVTGQLEYYKEREVDNMNYIKELERRLVTLNTDCRPMKDNNVRDEERNVIFNNQFEDANDNNSQDENVKKKGDSTSYNNNAEQGHDVDASKIIYERLNEKKIINDYINDTMGCAGDKISENNNDIGMDEIPVKDSKREDVICNEDFKQTQQTVRELPLASKANRVVDILMKLNSYEDINVIIMKLFGNDIEQRLSSCDVDEELLNQLEDSIKEIENLKSQDQSKDKTNIPDDKLDPSVNTDNDIHNTANNISNTDNHSNHSPSWNANENKEHDKKSDKYQSNNIRSPHSVYNPNNNYGTYDSIINYIPKQSNYSSIKTTKEYDIYNKRPEMKSSMRSTYSNSRHFSPPKKYENFDQSHYTICKSKSKTKNKNTRPDVTYMNKMISGKILSSSRNEECNFENSLRSNLRKGVKKINKDNNNHKMLNIPGTSYRNFFDSNFPNSARIKINNTDGIKSKSK